MKVTFEADTLSVIIDQMEDFISYIFPAGDEHGNVVQMPHTTAVMAKSIERMMRADMAKEQAPKAPAPAPADDATKTQANKERMAKARAAKVAKAKAPPVVPMPPEVTTLVKEPEPSPPSLDDIAIPEPEPVVPLDPKALAVLRIKTTEELQAAYALGKHDQVLGLLSKYGNGAKAFRELHPEDFVPIRKAIDEGALA